MTWNKDDAYLGRELPETTRQWTLELFAERHEVVYGPGRIVPEAWPDHTIHSDDAAAKREGLGQAVGSAPQAIAQIHRSMTSAFGAGWIQGGKISVKMIKPLLQGDLTTSRGRIVSLSLEPSPAGSPTAEVVRAHCETWVERADGTKVMVGSASAIVDRSSAN
jgi:acyl dehydratase